MTMSPTTPSAATAAYIFHGDRFTMTGLVAETGADVTGDVSGADTGATGASVHSAGFSVAVDAPSPETSRAVT